MIKLSTRLVAKRLSKRDTFTTLTTKAKLLALSKVAKEALYLIRLLKELWVILLKLAININCNNKHTIRLVTKDITKLQTKLQYIDLYKY